MKTVYLVCGLLAAVVLAVPGVYHHGEPTRPVAATLAAAFPNCGYYTWDGAVELTAPTWSQIDWTSNPNNCWIQDRSLCYSNIGHTYTYSGKVVSIEIEDRASCNSTYPRISAAYYRISDGITVSSWVQWWPS